MSGAPGTPTAEAKLTIRTETRQMDDVSTGGQEAPELERRLLEAADALLAHRGAGFALVPFPGRLPARCVVVGELAQLRELLKPVETEG